MKIDNARDRVIKRGPPVHECEQVIGWHCIFGASSLLLTGVTNLGGDS